MMWGVGSVYCRLWSNVVVFDVVFNVFVGSALENTALDGLKMALGMPTGTDSHPHPEMKSLEEQEDALEKAGTSD